MSINSITSENPHIQGFSKVGSRPSGSTFALRSSESMKSEGGHFNICHLFDTCPSPPKLCEAKAKENFGGCRSNFYILDHWTQILGRFVFLSAFILISLKIYKMEKQMQLDQIYELLDMETEHSETPKEWEWKNTDSANYILSLHFFNYSMPLCCNSPRKIFFSILYISHHWSLLIYGSKNYSEK